MSRRDWVTLALYALGMAFLLAGFVLDNEACLTASVGLVVGAVIVPLLDGPVLHLHVNVFMGGKRGGEGAMRMSDCRNGGRLTYLPPEGATLKRLAELNGEPPWELSVPDFYADVIPEESTELVGVLVWRGERFERARECELEPTFAEPSEIDGRWQEWTCSECGEFTFLDVTDEGERPNYCSNCGAKAKAVVA